MYQITAFAIFILILLLSTIIYKIYHRVTHNIIVNRVNDEFQELLSENNHNLDYEHMDDFMSKHYDVIDDIEIALDENNKIVYTLIFREFV